MTGTKVVSVVGSAGLCRPIAFFSGSSGIRICRGDGGEFMHQQVFPAQAWGTRYLTYHTINNTNTDISETNRNYYRVCVQDPNTVVRRNGVVLTGLQRNFFMSLWTQPVEIILLLISRSWYHSTWSIKTSVGIFQSLLLLHLLMEILKCFI